MAKLKQSVNKNNGGGSCKHTQQIIPQIYLTFLYKKRVRSLLRISIHLIRAPRPQLDMERILRYRIICVSSFKAWDCLKGRPMHKSIASSNNSRMQSKKRHMEVNTTRY